MQKIKKGDMVIAIAGKDKGKKGAVLTVQDGGEYLLVDGINIAKKSVKANPSANEPGGFTNKVMPIHRSNVMGFDPSTQKGSRVGIRTLKDGERVRYYKGSNEVIQEVKE